MKHIRETLDTNVNDLLRQFINRGETKYISFYSGQVVDNNDPDKNGRCRIRVFGVYGEEIVNNSLPWALPDFDFIGSKKGSFVVPPIDAIVKVYFDNGDIYLPRYTTKVVDLSNQSTLKDEDYPDTMVLFETDEGDYLTMNRKNGTFKFYHNSGNLIKMENNGDATLEIKNDFEQNIDGNDNLNVGGDLTEDIDGDKKVKASNITLENKSPTPAKAKIEIKNTGEVIIDGLSVKVTGTANVVVPTGQGGFCALPSCIYSGATHVGDTVV